MREGGKSLNMPQQALPKVLRHAGLGFGVWGLGFGVSLPHTSSKIRYMTLLVSGPQELL